MLRVARHRALDRLASAAVSKYGGRHRIESRRATKNAAPERALYVPPPMDDCNEESTSIEVSPIDRVVVRLRFWHGRTVDFAVMLDSFDEDAGQWCNVVRVDCCHGEVHRHELCRSGRPERRLVISPIPADDNEKAWVLLAREYDQAQEDLISGWDSYVGKWRQS